MSTRTSPAMLSDVVERVRQFEPIYLTEMEAVRLMNRTETKFVLSAQALPNLLEDLLPHYRCLEVDGCRLCDYRTLYFDTPELRLYHDHQSGRRKRYKIRKRKYMQSGLSFLEVKVKNNKGRTIKNRIPHPLLPFISTYDEGGDFLAQQTPYNPHLLLPVLWVNYSRITLVGLRAKERLTLDLNLSFHIDKREKSYPTIIVAEVKQESPQHSVFLDVMKDYSIRPGALSKYCLGMISLYKPIKHNRLKPQWRHLQKILTQ